MARPHPVLRNKSARRRHHDRLPKFESLEERRLLAVDWRNPVDALDVNADGFIAPLDALRVINDLNANSSRQLSLLKDAAAAYLDVSGDQFSSPIDVLQVINALNAGITGPRQLAEGVQLAAEAEATITLGQTNGARNYRLQIDAAFDTSSTGAAVEDVLAIYLVDPQQSAQTILDRGTPGTALFTLAGTRSEFIPGQVRWDGSVLTIDTTNLALRDTGVLKFQLLNSDSDNGSRVTIRPLSNDVDPDGAAGPTFPDGDSPSAAGGALDLDGLAATDLLAPQIENVRFDSSSGKYSAELRLTNHGPSVGRNVAVAFPGLPPGVTLRNPSGTTSGEVPYLNLGPAIAPGGLVADSRSNSITIELDDPSQFPFALRPQIFVGTNHAPTFDPVGPLIVSPGGVLQVPLVASDPDGDAVTFVIRGMANLPTGLLRGDGTLEFRPAPNQLGTYTFDVVASDGALDSTQTVTLHVVADPLSTTRVSGQVLQIDGQPLTNMPIEIGAVQGLTGSDGRFTLDLGTGPGVGDTLKIRGELFPGPLAYPFIAEKLAFVLDHAVFPGVNNIIDRPVYLPALDMANAKPIDPMEDVTVTTSAIPGISLFVAAGTLLNQQGTPYTGMLSITKVPIDQTPAALPVGSHPDLVVTIQPGEMVFAAPAPISFPNRAAYAPGTLMDLWSINPVTGEFDDVGDMRVSADGSTIDTISGGVRNSSWHDAIVQPANSNLVASNINPKGGCPNSCRGAQFASEVNLQTGEVTERHDLVTYQSLGQSRGLSLVFRSLRADPRPIVHFGLSDVPPSPINFMMATLDVSAGAFQYRAPGYDDSEAFPYAFSFPSGCTAPFAQQVISLEAGANSWRIPESGGDVMAALQVDLRDQPTGKYEYNLLSGLRRLGFERGPTTLDDGSLCDHHFSGFRPAVGSMSRSVGQIIHVNSIQSPFGAGWGLAGLQETVLNSDGSVLLVDGGGEALLFNPPPSAGEAYRSPSGDFSKFERFADGTFRRTLPDRTVYQFNANHKLATVRDRLGNETRYVYDAADRLTVVRDPVGLETTLSYVGGNLSTITDPAGRTTRLDYSAQGDLIQITDPDGSARRFRYDADHHQVSETDQRGFTEHTIYDFSGRPTSATRKDGSVIQVQPVQTLGLYPPERTVPVETRPSGGKLPARAFQVMTTHSIFSGSPLAAVISNPRATYVDANGNATVSQLNDAGAPLSERDSLGSLGKFDRNEENLVTSATDSRGNTTTYTYDEFGNMLSTSDRVLVRQPPNLSSMFPDRLIDTGIVPRDMVVVDVDHDTKLDVITVESGSISVLMSTGDGQFGPPNIISDVGGFSRGLALGDVNGDSHADIVAGGDGTSSTFLLLGTGDGAFDAAVRIELPISNAVGLTLVDVTGDDKLDLVAKGQNSSVILAGNGDGTFIRQDTVNGLNCSGAVSNFVDLDSDGHPDFVCGRNGLIAAQFGNGDGTFGERTTSVVSNGVNAFAFGDANGDSHLDVVTVAQDRHAGSVSLLLGDGAGNFGNEVQLSAGNGPLVAAFGDFDADQHLDLAFISDIFAANVTVLWGNGDGTFGNRTELPVAGGSFDMTLADINGDQHLDIVTVDHFVGGVLATRSNGDRTFDRPDDVFVVGQTDIFDASLYSMALGDVNGDDRLDAIAIDADQNNDPINRAYVLLGDGQGGFGNKRDFYVGDSSDDVALGDVNNDAIPDLLIAGFSSTNVTILIGDGSGDFGNPSEVEVGGKANALTVGDLNGDHNLDVVTANEGNPHSVSVLLGAGNTSFGDRSDHPVAGNPIDVALGDLDGDDDLDIVTANDTTDAGLSVLLGNGDGTFSERVDFAADQSLIALVLGDLDADGDLDIAAVSEDDFVSIFLGNGDGTFGDQTDFAAGRLSVSIAVGDLDLDGDLDLLTANHIANTVTILLGRGDGTFVDQVRHVVGHGPQSITLGDLDGDSDLDFVTANSLDGTLSPRINTANGGNAGFKFTTVTRQYAYDPVFGQPTSTIDELGRQTLSEIDPANGNLLSSTRVVGDVGGSDDVVTRYTYTAQGLVDTMTDALGRVTDFDYDSLGRLVAITTVKGTAEEATQRFEYDAAGNLTANIDQLGNRSELEYDEQGRMVVSRNALGHETHLEYDSAGNPISGTDVEGHTTRIEYDALHRPIKTKDAAGGETLFAYDAAGNRVRMTDPLGDTTKNRYDVRGRLVESIDPAGASIKLRYDNNDNLAVVTDAVGNLTSLVYDARNRLVREIDPLGHVTVYEYDASDHLIAKTDRLGRRTEFEYDELDRRSAEKWIGTNHVVHYTYDAVGRLRSAMDDFSSLAYTYDNRNHVTTIDNAGTPGAPHVELDYGYDSTGNILSAIDTINGLPGATTAYTYDNAARLTRIAQTGADVQEKRLDLAYNELGQYASIQRFSDSAGSQLVAGSTYTYDFLNRLATLRHASDSSTLGFYDFAYDTASRITSITDIDGITNYAYDDRNQLIRADHSAAGIPDEFYTYDANGNRVTSSRHGSGYITENGNRLMSDGSFKYQYNDEGSISGRTTIASGAHREFQWDHRNRLTTVIDKDAAGTELLRVEFTYDAFDRRISKEVLNSVDHVIEHFAHDGSQLILQFLDSDGAGAAQPGLDKRYLHGPDVDQVVAEEDAAGNVAWYLADHLGTVRDLVDTSGAAVNHITYDSFGSVISQTAGGPLPRFLFTGRELDSETGLYNYRARYFDPTTGRFISEDPIRFAGGDPNLFTYVVNDPARKTDPYGTAPRLSPLDIAMAYERDAIRGAQHRNERDTQVGPPPEDPKNPGKRFPIRGDNESASQFNEFLEKRRKRLPEIQPPKVEVCLPPTITTSRRVQRLPSAGGFVPLIAEAILYAVPAEEANAERERNIRLAIDLLSEYLAIDLRSEF